MDMTFYYEAENINDVLNRMNEIELQSDYAHDLIDRLEKIKQMENDYEA